ncbi:type II secretion system F family protein [Streptomyces xiaopingdaonensis]|uniref:type II secretion system F family protein n=1 Tax=Streptomyces xiaopingdaonensis TaxID=1565415 RepID=UPI001ED982EF|nr:type II secretion system F family protein [Streptomyces xiaopingdaonensis]
MAALGAGAGACALVGGWSGVLAGVVVAWGVQWWLRRRVSDSEREEREEVARQLPLCAELLAACLAAGSGPAGAAEAVGRSIGGPVAGLLGQTARELRLGEEPALVWERFGSVPGGGRLARCMARAGEAGVPAAETVSRLAAELRAAGARRAAVRARRAGVMVTGPLGLCFLPAFVVVGVVPVVLGLARTLV